MAEDWRERASALAERAESLDHGEPQVRLLEEAVRLADAHGDARFAYALRDSLIDAATFGGFPDKALVAFAWCRAQQKKDPERFDADSLLWKQKWVVGRLDEFPHISRKQISDALDDVEQTFDKVGAGKRSVLKLRYQAARDMGEESAAERLWEAWVSAPRDHLTDCRVCELDDELDHHVDKGEWAQAIKKARPILEGRQACAEIPHLTYGTLLYPMFKLEQWEQARQCHIKGYKLVSKNREFLPTVADHLEFLALTANTARGLTLVEKHLGWALDHPSHRDRFSFYVAAAFLLEGVKAQEVVSLRLPKSFPGHRQDGGYPVKDLLDWMMEQSRAIAAKFDARNGTDRFAKLMARTGQLKGEVRPVPID